MRSTPVWFGEGGRPLFGWLHLPNNELARGGVVLAPTLAVEELSAHVAYRELAEQLSRLGIATLRFDYRGTGDSSGGLADLSAESLIADVGEAIAFLREIGCEQIGLTGLRIGGTAAAVAALRDEHLHALALWDPAPNGRSFLREQRALKQLSIGDTPPLEEDDALELLGMVLSARQVGDLGALALPVGGSLASHVLLLERDDRARRIDLSLAPDADRVTISDLGGLVDVMPDDAALPEQSLGALEDFFDRAFHEETNPLRLVASRSATIEEGTSSITERAFMVGTRRLFAITTEPAVTSDAPTVVFLNAGLLRHIGPARLWVELSRRLAAQGIRCARLDLSGLGDSGTAVGQPRQSSYPTGAVEDIATVVDVLRPGDPGRAVFVGLCAGAYHSIETAITLGAAGICPINPILNFDPPELTAGGSMDPRRHAVQPYNRFIRWLRQSPRLRDVGERAIPAFVWSFLDRTGIQPSPARGLELIAERGTDVMLLCGEVEAIPFRIRARRAMHHLGASGHFRFELLAGADHTLFGARGRQYASELLVEHLTATFCSAAASDAEPVSPPLTRAS